LSARISCDTMLKIGIQSVLQEAIVSRTLSLPVSISPEAAARVAELGFQPMVDDLIAQAFTILPGLESLQLALVPSYEMDDIPWLVLECYGDRSEQAVRDALVAWYTWRAENLSFEVGRHFMLSWIHQEAAHAR
jgi:hypothetical protein